MVYPQRTLTRLRDAHERLSYSIGELQEARGLVGTGSFWRLYMTRYIVGLQLADENLTTIIERVEAEDSERFGGLPTDWLTS